MPLFSRKKRNPDGRPDRNHIIANLFSGIFMVGIMIWFMFDIRAQTHSDQHIRDTYVQGLAQITASRIDVDTSKPRRPYYLVLTYRYTVGGKSYVHMESVHEGDGQDGEARANAAAKTFARDSYLTIYYDPANPDKTALYIPAPEGWVFYLEVAGLWLATIALFIKGIAGLRFLGP